MVLPAAETDGAEGATGPAAVPLLDEPTVAAPAAVALVDDRETVGAPPPVPLYDADAEPTDEPTDEPAGGDEAPVGAVAGELDAATLPPPPLVVPTPKPRVEPSGVTILGPVRPGGRASADDEDDAATGSGGVLADEPLRIVTMEDLERERRLDAATRGDGHDQEDR